MKDYYYILGISKNATADEIKKAYRKLCLKFHPDKNEGDVFYEHRFKEIVEAYKTLGSDENRQMYDRLMRQHESKFHTASQFANTTQVNHFYKPYNTPGSVNIKREEKVQARLRSRARLKSNLGRSVFSIVGLSIIIIIIANTKEPESNLAYADLHTDTSRLPVTSNVPGYPENPAINTLHSPMYVHRQFAARRRHEPHHSPAPVEPAIAKSIADNIDGIFSDTLSATKEKTESLLLGKLRAYTPEETYIGPGNNVGAGMPEKDYHEKGYTYSFSNNNLVVEYLAYHSDNLPTRFREVIPVRDIDRVYAYDGNLWIGTNTNSIAEHNLATNTKFMTSFFAVKYDIGKEQSLEQALFSNFIHLRTFAGKTGVASAKLEAKK